MKTEILKREQFYIDQMKLTLNILNLAGNSLGYKHDKFTIEKRSLVKKGKYLGEENSFYGKTHSEKTI